MASVKGEEVVPVHIIPWSLDYDRIMFVLEKNAAVRIHFLDPTEKEKKALTKDHILEGEALRKEIEKEYKHAQIKVHEVCCYEFDELLLHVFEIIAREKELKNRVIPHCFAGSTIYRIALYMASSLNHLNVRYVRAKDYSIENGKMITYGVDKSTYTKIDHFPITLPDSDCSKMLEILLSHEESQMKCAEKQSKKGAVEKAWSGNRLKLVQCFYPSLRGNQLTKSKETRITNIINRLKDRRYIHHQTKKGRMYKLRLTEQGRLMAEIMHIKREVADQPDPMECISCSTSEL